MGCLQRFESYLLYEKRCSGNTLLSYKTDLKQFESFCARHEVNFPYEVEKTHIRSWLAHLSLEQIKPSSINRKLSSLKTFYNFCLQRKLVEDNPTIQIKGLKKPKSIPGSMKESEISAMFSRLHLLLKKEVDSGKQFSLFRDLIVLELLYSTGMRRAELTGLKVVDINFERQLVRVFGKGSKEREIPLGPQLIDHLNAYLQFRDKHFASKCDFLIVTEKGLPAYDKYIYLLVRKYMEGITSLEKKSPHVLRHSFATHLTENGAQLPEVRELMGHTSLAATEIYLNHSMTKIKEIYRDALPR
jgi:integrase/recombinase XerC